MLPNDIHHVYLKVKRNGVEEHHPAGRFLVRDGMIHHLEDYYGLLKDHVPPGAIDNYTMAKLAQPPRNMEHVSHTGLRDGHRLHLINEINLPPLPTPQKVTPQMVQAQLQSPPKLHPVWHYTRAGHDKPHVLESNSGRFLLDGNALKDEEVATILDNVRTGVGKIRYVKPGVQAAVAKMEQLIVGLRKNDETEEHFKVLQQAGVPQDTIDHMRRRIYGDEMAQGVGNKFAWESFHQKRKPGVYISMDGNDFKAINDTYGHSVGNEAIGAFGRAAREAMDEAVGSHQSKLFRNPDEQNMFRSGGDEFVAHVPSHEHAARFARKLREKLDAIPAVGGTHKLSMAFGFGNDYESSDKALYQAKEQKYSAPGTPGLRDRPRNPGMNIGQVPSLAHSNVPGFEGPVPLNADQLTPHAPPVDARPTTTAPAPSVAKPGTPKPA